MKILHVDTQAGFRGGESQVLLLMEGLKEKGYENFLVATEGGVLANKAKPFVESVFTIKPRRVLDLINISKICKFIKLSRADILHLHTSHSHLIGGFAGAMKDMPVVVTKRVDFPIRGKFKYNKFADKIIAISQAIEKVLVEGGVEENKIVVIYSGVDIKRFESIREPDYLFREFNIPKNNSIIGTVAHLTDHKGHVYLLEAIPKILKEYPNYFFLFVGEGELKESLIAKARMLGVKNRVIFTGFRKDVPEILSALDLFVLPSHLEGLCTSLMDAMYMKVPVVATTAGGIPEVIEHGKTGLLVPPKNTVALAEAVIQLLSDEDMRKSFAREGRKRVLKNFVSSVMVEKVDEVYRSL